ncbi:hypothetical protein [Rana grylio virus]|uniref:Uncharacterized protein n=2 Tax=Frog virus 3 TaxID=10493 RepID=H9XFK2_FRG3V|nr:hypothetical protein [Rana grylio virus]AVM86105.1 hypothetical protein [Rana nigromaculata ranavirus]
MTLPGVSGPLGPLSPGTNGTLWSVGPRVVRYQIPALAYLPPGPFGPSGPAGPVSPAGPLGPATPSGPFTPSTTMSGPWGHSGPRPHGDRLRVHVGSKQIVYIVQMQDATDARCEKTCLLFHSRVYWNHPIS